MHCCKAGQAFRSDTLPFDVMKAPKATHSSSAQILWAGFIVLIALWVIAFAAHLGGGVITYLLIISLAVLLIRSATSRNKAASVQQDNIKNGPNG